MFADSFLSLLLGFCLDLAGVYNELILHDDGHVSHSQFRLIRLDQSQFDFVVFLL